MVSQWLLTIVLGCVLLSGIQTAPAATIIFGNFEDVGPPFQYGSASTIGALSGVSSLANGFVPLVDSSLNFIEVAIASLGFSEFVTVSLASDDGFAPASTLETWTYSEPLGLLGDVNSPLMLLSQVRPVLRANSLYWVVISTGPSSLIGWNNAVVEDLGPYAVQMTDGAWTSFVGGRDAFRVLGDDVPESGTFALACLGLSVLWLSRQLRQ